MRGLLRFFRHIGFGLIGILVALLILLAAETPNYVVDRAGNKLMFDSPEFGAMVERKELPAKVVSVWQYGPVSFESSQFPLILPLVLATLGILVSKRIGRRKSVVNN